MKQNENWAYMENLQVECRLRLRKNSLLRDMLSENSFNQQHLVQPLFLVEDLQGEEAIFGLKGTHRQSMQSLLRQIEQDLKNGVRQFLLFYVPNKNKNKGWDRGFANLSQVTAAIAEIKKTFGSEIFLWVDVCLCSWTSHGHCCFFDNQGQIELPSTVQALAELALAFAWGGCDGVAPSDMMDGRVRALRKHLDANGFPMIPLMSYSTKFASNFYGPFRAAAGSAPQFGDRKQYQIDVRSRSDAIASSVRCHHEGADLLMVKPGMPSMDLIRPIFRKTGKPVGAYQVSGEYAALVLLNEKQLMNFEAGLLESWQVLRRAGAQFIITYGARYAKEVGL